MKKLLITGATGFLGRYLLDGLINNRDFNNIEVHCLVRPVNMTKLNKYPINIIEGDLLNEKSLYSACKEMDIIIHLASVLDSNDPNLKKVNVNSSLNVIKNIKNNAKLIFLSSATVNYPIKTQYADSKLIIEQALKKSNIRYTIIRPSWIYGNQSRSFEKLLKYARKSKVIPIINLTIQPVFVEDVVNLIIDSIEKYDKETIEISGKKIKYRIFILKIANYFKQKPIVIELPYIFFWNLYYLSTILPMNILSKDSLIDFKFSTNVDLKILLKKYNVSPRTIEEVLSEGLIS